MQLRPSESTSSCGSPARLEIFSMLLVESARCLVHQSSHNCTSACWTTCRVGWLFERLLIMCTTRCCSSMVALSSLARLQSAQTCVHLHDGRALSPKLHLHSVRSEITSSAEPGAIIVRNVCSNSRASRHCFESRTTSSRCTRASDLPSLLVPPRYSCASQRRQWHPCRTSALPCLLSHAHQTLISDSC